MSGHDYELIGVTLDRAHVATVELRNGQFNYFDLRMISELCDAFGVLDEDPTCRAIVLAAQGKAFCAGANFGGGSSNASPFGDVADEDGDEGSIFRRTTGRLYGHAVRLFQNKKPIVGAIHGSAVGGGLGLALVPDFRVTCKEAKFSANFSLLGIHPGFGLTYTLPALIGASNAHLMFFTGRRLNGEQACEIGLADILTERDQVRAAAYKLAAELASAAPLAVMSIRETVRAGLADKVRAATNRELQEQEWLIQTEDAAEGVKAVAERRAGNFKSR